MKESWGADNLIFPKSKKSHKSGLKEIPTSSGKLNEKLWELALNI